VSLLWEAPRAQRAAHEPRGPAGVLFLDPLERPCPCLVAVCPAQQRRPTWACGAPAYISELMTGMPLEMATW